MKAIRIHEHGSVDVLRIDEIDPPRPQENEVVVKMKATSLNHMDIWVRDGIPGAGVLPLTLGCDGSGIVEECGSNVNEFSVGDRVFIFPLTSCGECSLCLQGKINQCRKFNIVGEHVNGTHCEYFCIDSKNVMKLDAVVSFEQAAAFPLVFLTAWHMLVQKAQVTSEDVVLVIGASSGVGSAAVQIAKLFGAKVIATAGSQRKMDKALEWGADHVIHHYEESISKRVRDLTAKQGASIIFEHVGEKVWDECTKSLAWHGKIVTCGATSGSKVNLDLTHIFFKQQSILGSTMGTREDIQQVYKYIVDGKLKPCVDKIFPYQNVVEAHRYLEDSNNFGKVVLSWDNVQNIL